MANPNTRTPREADEQRQRRRRDVGTLDRMQTLRLAVPQSVKDSNPDRDFRWFNDTGNRIHNKTVMDDWDKVPGVDPIVVGTTADGHPLKAFLCMKPMEFVREDEKAKMQELKEMEAGLVRGKSDESDLKDRAYADEGNLIGRVS